MDEAKQNNDKVSMATAAEEEAPGKGSVDGMVEVQDVTEPSGTLQPNSFEGPASDYISDIRHRYRSMEKQKLERVVIEVSLDSPTDGYLVSKQAAEIAGVVSVKLGVPVRNLLQVIGDGVDAVHLVNLLRKKFGNAKLISPGPVKEQMKDVMEDEGKDLGLQSPAPPSIPPRPISKSPVVTGGTTDTEHSTNTPINPDLFLSLDMRSASSHRSRTAEWALLVTSVVLEATSASCDQLGYALTSMVMAFLALFLSILDLIFKARERGITCDGRGLLPCFYRHDVRNRKPFASLVQYFGLAGAVWQCSFTTVGYHYTHHKLVNPIKLCLLPFILALCVLISKVVKSSQHES